jgi:hypothetical protein
MDDDCSSNIIEKPDLLIRVHEAGYIVLFTPITDAAKQWIAKNVADDWQWFGPALVVEDRDLKDLVNAMAEAVIQRPAYRARPLIFSAVSNWVTANDKWRDRRVS